MIQVKAPQVSYGKEIAELVRVFYPEEQVGEMLPLNEEVSEAIVLETGYDMETADTCRFYAYLYRGGSSDCSSKPKRLAHQESRRSYPNYDEGLNRFIKDGIKGCVFDLLAGYTGRHPRWGAQTGVRPVKLVQELLDKGKDDAEIRILLRDIYKMQDSKIELLLETAKNQRHLIDEPINNKVSVYIHIPFCSTRCFYCSFPSDLIHRAADKMDEYLSCLERELASVMGELKKQGTEVDTLYIGGGTPTVLSRGHLEELLKLADRQILSRYNILEYTIEAGRPDSLDNEKLKLMRDYGVSRISINPQSMNQETLDLVGRGHTVEQVLDIYHKAREIGFFCINMDVILGLPEETADHMERTMEALAGLKPDNITVHTLAVKRASVFRESFKQYDPSRKGLAEEMALVCRKWIDKLGMKPYYLYRQKYMLDHLENVGYSVPGKECLYNIQFMEERRDIWAFGAGAASKLYFPDEDRIERIGNVKNLDSYLYRIDEMIERKLKALKKGGN
ncbi:MAG: coproporphyrinogen dehydrogenase HemZ [Caldicoprobacterales bacterium]|jgi:coproporphyrinogen dehydrogenase HemZ